MSGRALGRRGAVLVVASLVVLAAAAATQDEPDEFQAINERIAVLDGRVEVLEEWKTSAQQLLLSLSRLGQLNSESLNLDLDICALKNLALILESQHPHLREDPDWPILLRSWSNACDDAREMATRLR